MPVQAKKQATIQEIPLVMEEVNGVIQHYYPLGEYVVAQPQVCDGRPTIKYTRIDARHILGALQRGEAAELIADDYQIPVAAVHEAVKLAEIYDYERSYG